MCWIEWSVTYLEFQEYNLNDDSAFRISFSHAIGIRLPQPNYIPIKARLFHKPFKYFDFQNYTHTNFFRFFSIQKSIGTKIDEKVRIWRKNVYWEKSRSFCFKSIHPLTLKGHSMWTYLGFRAPIFFSLISLPHVTNKRADLKYTLK